MQLAHLTWPQVGALDRDIPVLIPTGAIEQHGAHLPVTTDTTMATAICAAVDDRLGDRVLVTPTLWFGASLHHTPFPGTLAASFELYDLALRQVIGNLGAHGFHRFLVLNAHGGNSDPNRVALRRVKHEHPEYTLAEVTYPAFWPQQLLDQTLEGPIKGIRHACEAETSLMLHVAPDLVPEMARRDDGLEPEPPVQGLVSNFDEITEGGSFGYASRATAEKGRILFESAVDGTAKWVQAVGQGHVLRGIVG